jgi:hypothetical protein
LILEYFQHGHALVVGVGGDLPNTEDDAEGLAKVLRDPVRCAYPPDQVRPLIGQNANRDNILSELKKLSDTDPGSSVVIYFSGHGYRITNDLAHSYYLLPFGYDTSKLEATAVSGVEFTAALQAITAQKVLVVLDCCHAGGIGITKSPAGNVVKSPMGVAAIKSAMPPDAATVFAEGKGRVLLASAREDELSYGGRPYSVFTLALIEALCGMGAAKKDGYVRFSDLAGYTREAVSSRTGGKQHPVQTFRDADDFAVAYYAGGQLIPKAPPFSPADIKIEAVPGAQNPNPQIKWNIGGDLNIAGGDNIRAQQVYRIEGDFYQAGRDFYKVERDLVISADKDDGQARSLAQLFAELRKAINKLPAAEQPIVTAFVVEVQSTAEQIQRGDDTAETEAALSRSLKNLVNFAPSFGEELLTKLSTPSADTPLGIREAIEKLRARGQ